MKLLGLRMHNFGSYFDCTLDLSGVSLCSVVGANGTGKSTIIESICWALFGTAKVPNKDLVRSGADSMSVKLTFELNEKNYEILRKYDGTTSVILKMGTKEIAIGSTGQKEAITKVLGVSKELLLQSIIISQGQLSSFVNAMPAERRDLVTEILNLNKYSGAWDLSKQSLQSMSATVAGYRGTVMSMRQELDKIPEAILCDQKIESLNAKIEDITSKISAIRERKSEIEGIEIGKRNELARLSEEVESINMDIAKCSLDYDKEIEKIDLSVREIAKQEADLEFLNGSVTSTQKLIESIEVANKRISELRGAMIEHERAVKSFRDRLALATSATGKCPFCEGEISQAKWDSMVGGMKNELASLVSQMDDNSREIKRITPKNDSEQVKRQLASQIERVVRIGVMIENRPSLLKHIEELRAKKAELIQELNNKLAQANMGINTIRSAISMEGDVLESQISILSHEHKSVSQDYMDWKSIRKSREALEKSLLDAQGHLELSKERLPEMEFIESALSPKGVPLMIVDHYLPMIEARAQDILSSMSDGALKIKIVISDSGNRKGIELMAGTNQLRPARSLSGGEQTRVALAIRVAISQILAENSGCQFDCLFVDEVEYLDEKGVQQFMDSVISLQSRFSQIFVMSHVPAIRDAFPQSIMVTKQDNISVAEVIA